MKRLFLFFICSVSMPAAAQVSLCNQQSGPLLVSIGVESKKEIFVFGWHTLEKGQCLVSVQDTLRQLGKSLDVFDRLWVHGRDRINAPGREFGAGADFCVDDVFETFKAEFADSTCEKRGYIRASFSEIQLPGSAQESGVVDITAQGLQFHP